jgi:MFS family permease
MASISRTRPRNPPTPWRTVWLFGLVSLLADMIYEGARAYTGPYLLSLGASATLIGLVTGVGEGSALVLRLVFGPWADRSGNHWNFAVAGYAVTCLAVPLLVLAPWAGGLSLLVASILLITERVGKAMRSPSKSVLLAEAAKDIGHGTSFGIHKALDQVGAFFGPLLIAGLLALGWASNWVWPVFALPGMVALGLLWWLRSVTNFQFTQLGRPNRRPCTEPKKLPRQFHQFAVACALFSFGLLTFGVISVHLVQKNLVPAALVPIVYAALMLIQAVVAPVTGRSFDRWGSRVLFLVPLLVVLVPWLGLSNQLLIVSLGLVAWASTTSILDSTVKAWVARHVPRNRLATAYGLFAAWQGTAVVAGGAIGGWLYAQNRVPSLQLLVTTFALAGWGLLIASGRKIASSQEDATQGIPQGTSQGTLGG